MRLLLDTHVWIWRLLAPERVSPAAERALANRENVLHLSPISVWETLVLARKGRLSLTPSPIEWVLRALRLSAPLSVPLTHEIAIRSDTLDAFASQDPADRFLVATAVEHGLALVSADQAMRSCPDVETIW